MSFLKKRYVKSKPVGVSFKWNKEDKSDAQKHWLYIIETLYNAQKGVTKWLDNYSTIASEAKYKTIHGKGLKILTPKQMLQQLPLELPWVKASNRSGR